LGFTGYYRKIIKNYACIENPLTSLLKKKYCVWNEEATLVFSLLKYVIYFTHVLETTDFGKTFVVECDASGQGWRSIDARRETIGF
jgi:hypothetical protein